MREDRGGFWRAREGRRASAAMRCADRGWWIGVARGRSCDPRQTSQIAARRRGYWRREGTPSSRPPCPCSCPTTGWDWRKCCRRLRHLRPSPTVVFALSPHTEAQQDMNGTSSRRRRGGRGSKDKLRSEPGQDRGVPSRTGVEEKVNTQAQAVCGGRR